MSSGQSSPDLPLPRLARGGFWSSLGLLVGGLWAFVELVLMKRPESEWGVFILTISWMLLLLSVVVDLSVYMWSLMVWMLRTLWRRIFPS